MNVTAPMSGSRAAGLVLVLAFLGLIGCSSHRDITIDGPYHLVAGDEEEQMSVCYDGADGCIGRIPSTVYAVGADATYVVAARHPQANKTITEYYYVVRSADLGTADTSAAVHGPFGSQAFDGVRSELHLPALSYEIPRLK